MYYGTLNQLNAYFNIGILVSSVLLCIFYYASAKRIKSFTPSRNLTLVEIYEIIKVIPSHVFHHKVKRIEPSKSNALNLDCSTVKILITQNANEIKCVYKMNGFINLVFTLTFGLFGVGGFLALFDGGESEALIGIAIAVGVHIIRGKVLNRGRNIVVSIEEHLR